MTKTLATALVIPFLFLGCKETTTDPIITDIASIQIDTPSFVTLYPTDKPVELYASVTHTDGSTGDATKTVTWSSSDTAIISTNNNLVSGGYKNGGDANITISYKVFSDTLQISAAKLQDFNITTADINTTGDHPLEAVAQYADGNRTIYTNILWESNVSTATFSTTDYITTINIADYSGDINISATVFAQDNETNITKSVIYTIN